MTARCAAVVGSPTCRLPDLGETGSTYTCPACRRVWRVAENVRKQRYWRWDAKTKPKVVAP